LSEGEKQGNGAHLLSERQLEKRDFMFSDVGARLQFFNSPLLANKEQIKIRKFTICSCLQWRSVAKYRSCSGENSNASEIWFLPSVCFR